jgi:hypothetical protein
MVAIAAAIVGLAGLTVVGVASVGGAEPPGHLPDPRIAASEGQTIDLSSVRVIREFEEPEGEIRWTVVTYRGSEGPCMDVYAESLAGGDSAKTGGCGEPQGPFMWGIGGVEVGGRWFNLVDGRGPPGATSMRVTLGDGRSLEATLVEGTYLLVIPGERATFDVKLIQAVGPGDQVSSVHPPSVSAVRQKAAEAASEASDLE